VDDQHHFREMFHEEIKDEGYSVMSVSNVASAKRYMKESKPHLVLLDLYLNGFEGWDLLCDIKKRVTTLPVLILTASDNYRDDPRASLSDGYIVKNVMALKTLKQ